MNMSTTKLAKLSWRSQAHETTCKSTVKHTRDEITIKHISSRYSQRVVTFMSPFEALGTSINFLISEKCT